MDVKEKAREYVSQMTLEEKASLCTGSDFWHLHGVERLGLPGIAVADGPHGLRKQLGNFDCAEYGKSVPATCFPTASAVACTFDRDLAFEMGRAMGEECRENDIAVLLGPGVNLKRSPLCGRNFEYFSEDPLVAGEMAVAMIRGLQSVGVGASLKHFAANSQETARFVLNSIIDARALRELYLRPFEIAVKKGKPWTVMTAYNQLNGAYCGESPALMDILRTEWGFDGVAVSDWGAVHDIVAGIKASLDLEMPGVRNGHIPLLIRAVKSGVLPEETLNQSARRVTALLLKAQEAKRIPYHCDMQAHHALARRIARDAAVLLKNDALLPGSPRARTAVIGAFAKQPRYQGSGSSRICPFRLDTPYDALTHRVNDVTYAAGYRIDNSMPDETLIAQAVEAARGKDIVYLFAGLPDAWENEGYDRRTMDLPRAQTALIHAVCAANPNTAVILQAGSPVALPWRDAPRAILMLYLGGSAGGSAAAELLLGETSPAGRLAETFPFALSDTPCAKKFPARRNAQYRESIYIGYRFYDAANRDVAYPFGHGLSYTTFSYRDLTVTKSPPDAPNDAFTVRFRVKNTGMRAGDEVVQLYLAPPVSALFRPPQTLVDFARLHLLPGEEKQVRFTLGRDAFTFYSVEETRFAVEGGTYDLRIGASSRDIRLHAPLEMTGDNIPVPDRPLPHYYRVDGTFPKEEFTALLGDAPPQYTPPGRGHFTHNTTLRELSVCLPGRVAAWCVRRYIYHKEHQNRAAARALWNLTQESPLRQAFTMGVSDRLLYAFLHFCNGEYRKALRALRRGITDK